MSAVVAAAFLSSALAWNSELESRSVVRPKSVTNWLTVAPAAVREKTIGLLRAPAAMRLPDWESTPVRLRKAVGKRAERVSRTYCCACRARSLPMVICGLLRSAMASASSRLKDLPSGPDVLEACAAGFAVAPAVWAAARCGSAGTNQHNPARISDPILWL